jgi:hypothetical protein
MCHIIRKDFTMKFFLFLIAVFSWTSLSFAQADGSTAKEQTGTTMNIRGKVVSVDAIANTIIVKTKRNLDTLSVKSGAKIMFGMMELSKETTLGDLQTDAKVTVTWETIDGKRTATEIVVESTADSKWKKGID